MHLSRVLAALFFSTALVAAPAWAGPPLICHPNDIGSARSLPWLATSGWNAADPAYDLSHLRDDTLDLLTPRAPVEVRMETIRRAVIYATHERGLDDRLTIALFGRVLNAQARGTADPSAWFDAGYYAEAVNEMARIYPNLHALDNVDGMSWMQTAVRLGGAGMQPAVAAVERARTQWHQ